LKKKIAFYLENEDIRDIDFRYPEKGNPGCGGTEYLFTATPYYLSTLKKNKYTIVLIANCIKRLPDNLYLACADNLEDAARTAKKLGCDIFIYRPRRDIKLDITPLIDNLRLLSIAWAHVQLPPETLKKMAKSDYLKKLVCVEHEQYDAIQDTALAALKRLTFIVNGFDLDGFRLSSIPNKDKKLVVYIGALVPQKGFHVLARAWPNVIKTHPDARLIVIGSSTLYDHNSSLGPWGVADKSYEEEEIIPHLKGKDGNPHKSVFFAKRLGHEKKEILHKALIGVANPTGISENCPGSSLEFSASGTAVISGAYFGMVDVIKHKETGLLGKKIDDLTMNICKLIENPKIAIKMGEEGVNYVQMRYNWKNVINEWDALINSIVNDSDTPRIPFKKNIFFNYKILVMLNRFLQITLGSFIDWPSLGEFKIIIKLKFYKLKKFVFR